MSKLIIYSLEDLLNDDNKDIFKSHNAFIYPNGEFTLADGYDSRDATHLVELSANEISKNYKKPKNLLDGYRNYLTQNPDATKLYFLRDILIHFYGFTLFASTSSLKISRPFDRCFETFIIPDKPCFDKSVTIEQITTLKNLHLLNADDIAEEDFDKLFRLERKKVEL